jgi:hypothetical protein
MSAVLLFLLFYGLFNGTVSSSDFVMTNAGMTMNRKGCGKMRSWHNSRYYPQIYQKGLKSNRSLNYCRDLGMYIYRRGLDWLVDLLTTYPQDWELQAIITLSLIYTLYKSLQHTLSLFQPAASSPAVPWQRLLTVEILQLHVY